MTRIGIYSAAMVSAGGRSLNRTWDALVTGQNTRSLSNRLQQFKEPKYTHMTDYPWWPDSVGRHLFDIAVGAADQIMDNDAADTICVGSTTDGYAELQFGKPQEKPLADFMADRYGIKNRYQFSNACASSSTAIIHAYDLLRTGRADIVLAGGADEVLSSGIAAFDACRIYADKCRPFDKDRRGLVLGEAAAFFLMARDTIGGRPLAWIDGVGSTCDAMDAAAMNSIAISQAIMHTSPIDIDYIMAHGTGTIENDQAEADAIRQVWPDYNTPLVASYKGALGHPQGASGAVGLALVLEAFESGHAFVTDIQTPDEDLNLKLKGQPTLLNRALVLSYGTWGVNTAIKVARE